MTVRKVVVIAEDVLYFYRASAYWRAILYSKYVCPSVRYVPVCINAFSRFHYENGLTHCHSFFTNHSTLTLFITLYVGASEFWLLGAMVSSGDWLIDWLIYQHQTSSQNSDEVNPCGGAKYRWGIKIPRFWTNNSLYIANDTRYRHSYYGKLIGTHTRSIKVFYFQ